jgi:hypothetical protein
MDPRIKQRVETFLADLDRSAVSRHVLGVVVAGSAARGEELWDDDRLLSDIDLMVLTRRTDPFLIARIDRLIARHADDGLDGGQVPLGPLATYVTLAFVEARANGVVVRGSADLRRLIPPTAPADIPLWEGIRVLANRLVEHVKFADGVLPAARVVAKSYESLAEAHLVLERRHRPSYAERLDELERRAPAGVPADTVSRMITVLAARVHRHRPPEGLDTPDDVALARQHLLAGLAAVGSRHTGVSGDPYDQLRALARTQRHWRHRLYWAALMLRQGRDREVDLSVDPVVRIWQRTLAVLGGPPDPARRRALLRDWRRCPQILARRSA